MIKDCFTKNKPVLSFEVFPPKKEGDFAGAYETLRELKELKPDFISVTYGAGGSKSKKTIEIASYIQNELGIDALAHLTCVGCTRTDLALILKELEEQNISHVLALRGDRPDWMNDEQFFGRDFAYAADMITYLKENSALHITGACYPEKHFEATSFDEDLNHLKEKTEQGTDFLITQLFFDNSCFYRFRDACQAKGIVIPISTGIMPVTSAAQLGRTVSLSGSSVPKKLADILALYGDNPTDMRKAGIDYAIRQCLDLKRNGVDGLHLYTMNKSTTAREIMKHIANES